MLTAKQYFRRNNTISTELSERAIFGHWHKIETDPRRILP